MKRTKRLLSLFLCAMLLLAVLPLSASADTSAAWDGRTIDVSWYNKTDKAFYLSTPEQLMGLAAIVNGLYNAEIVNVIGDKSVIVDNFDETDGTGANGNNKSTGTYHYGADDFNGRTIYLTADLNMGGSYDPATDTWSGPNFMPIGGQYLMAKNDSTTKLSSSFCGTLNGQGHFIYNIYCERHCSNGNFGDGQSVGVIGRLGVHDSDPVEIRPTDPAVRNLAVTGWIYANRSVGGIVGKIGKTTLNSGDNSTGGIIENCANFATVSNTDAKGCGGIVGAGWNGGVVRNCYNAGNISTTYVCPTGGISGSNEIILENCYNVGQISAVRDSYAMALGTNNGGAPSKTSLINCWYLDGSAAGGGYYDSRGPMNDNAMSAADMKKASFVTTLGGAYTEDENNINDGYPILAWQKDYTALPAPNAPAAPEYTDVDGGAWYAPYVDYVTERGLFDATGASTFSPEAPMTRAMLAVALYRMAGAPAVEAATPFTDVSATDGYAPAVAWCYANGIISGFEDSTFRPAGEITREQIAAMFYRYASIIAKADMTARNDLAIYTDKGDVASWALANVQWAVEAGLITGMTADTIAPRGTATRAQAAAMVQRLATYIA